MPRRKAADEPPKPSKSSKSAKPSKSGPPDQPPAPPRPPSPGLALRDMVSDRPLMPDLCTPTRSVWQTADAAVEALARLGVALDRVVLESAGPGWEPHTVIHQSPAPGTPLEPQSRVVLGIAGSGALESLPFALREEEPSRFGTDQFFALFDSPMRKLALHMRAGGRYLELSPDEPITALRWIREIFQLQSAPWQEHEWYALATVLPTLGRSGGRADGLDLAFRGVFGIPVQEVRLHTTVVPLPAGTETRLGTANGRLGVDAVVGRGVSAAQQVEVVLGPMPLELWLQHLEPGMRERRDVIYWLALPAAMHARVQERWIVGDPTQGSHLGDAQRPARLGVASYLGAGAPGSTT